MRDRSRSFAALSLGAGSALAAAMLATTPASAQRETGTRVTVEVTDLRNARGVIRACITDVSRDFHECEGGRTQRVVVPARGDSVTFIFGGVRPGRYAIALLHDENNNNRADAVLGMMPREGFGFSRDAAVRMGPPSFSDAAFEVGTRPVRQTITMRYML